uniref:Uncharacterized protein n=1 Tax=Romanomermis culicivorax TaxID=13658 RepID=A0A915K5D9_ROMCU
MFTGFVCDEHFWVRTKFFAVLYKITKMSGISMSDNGFPGSETRCFPAMKSINLSGPRNQNFSALGAEQ